VKCASPQLMRGPLDRSGIRAAFGSSQHVGRITMRAYMRISGALFGIIALAHLLRLVRHWPIDLAGYMVPLWVSWLGVILAGGLSIWALRLVRGTSRVA
jgi:hypothetical protein